jgi:hypothetical protein
VNAFGNLSLSFEDNRGQAEHQVDFRARGNGTTFFLNYSGVAIVLRRGVANPVSLSTGVLRSIRHRPQTTPATMQMKLVGADARARALKAEPLQGRSNYLIGRDPKLWRTNIPNYGKVSYTNVYPGIDVTYYGNRRRLEYDFMVKPGANPSVIAVEFVGAEKVEVDSDGNLRLRLGDREIVQRKPFIYQEADGVGRAVSGRYVSKGGNKVGFEIGNYDAKKLLVIDPVLVYSTYLGGGGDDQGIGVALDASGKAYVTGVTSSTDFPVTNGAAQATKAAASDIFITKLNATGTAALYSTYIGGSGNDEGLGIAVDLAGGAYVTGFTDSTNFPVTQGSVQTTRGGGTDAFVLKLNSVGTGLSYSTYLGGDLDEEGYGVAVDTSGNTYAAGVTDSANFPTNAGFQTTKSAGSDAFISKLNFNGTVLSHSTFIGGDGLDWGFAVTTDAGGNAYVAGVTGSSNFPTTSGSLQNALGGPADGFITKVNTTIAGPTSLAYSTYLGGSGFDMCAGVALDATGSAYVTGLTASSNFPTTGGASQTAGGGSSDAFVSKIHANGSSLLYSTYLGGSGPDWGRGITVDTSGQAYVTGSTESPNFPVVAGAFQSSGAGKSDAFASKVNAAGTSLVYSSYLGGSNPDDGFGITSDLAGNVLVTGTTFSNNFPVTQGAFQTIDTGGGDTFLAKIARQEIGQPPNQIDAPPFFVKQHYLDFLGRATDADGLAFWIGNLTSCNGNQQCIEVRRVNVSAAFFLSIEFKETGFLVYRFTKASFNVMPRYELFLPDVQEIGRGVIVNAPGWEQLLAANQRAFAEEWVKRPAFKALYDGKSNAQYVDALFANAGVTPGAQERTELINGLDSGTETRTTVLRKVADNQTLIQQEFNRAFVLEQYFGYLRRNPDDPPDNNLDGFNFWLSKLNQFNGNFVQAEMVRAFISSIEYRQRFGTP